MDNLWKQIFSGRLTLGLICAGLLGFALVGLSYYSSSKENLPQSVAPLTTAGARDLPMIDQVVVEQTEFALFALG